MAPLTPAAGKLGRPRKWPCRAIWNAIFYGMRGGIAWRLLPKGLPPKSNGLWLVCSLADNLIAD